MAGRTTKAAKVAIFGTVAVVCSAGLYVAARVEGCKRDQYALNNIKQIPFDQARWVAASPYDISVPNARAAMNADLIQKWRKGTDLRVIIQTLRAPDFVSTPGERDNSWVSTPRSYAFAMSYGYASSWDGWVMSIVFFFDKQGKLLATKAEVD